MDSAQIGHYQIIDKLGEGGMGVVYKAMDLSLGRYVAIKMLAPELVANRELLERFRLEAVAQARLSHTNIATLHAFEQVGSTWLIVMEYLDGESFADMVARRGPIPAAEAVPLFRQALLGIGFAHRAGVIHRDIKPSNIMVTTSGIVKVMDFGIAKVMGGQRLTKTGTRVGTVAYMSPEQIRNQPVDIRSDIYSLGVTLFELLSAHLPFESESDFQVMSDHVSTPPPLPTRYYPYIPPGVEKAALEALNKDPDQRFQTCEAFGAALEHPSGVADVRADVRQTVTPIPIPTPTPTPPPRPTSAPAQGGWLDQIKSQAVAPTPGAPTPVPLTQTQPTWPPPDPLMQTQPTWPPQPGAQAPVPTPPPLTISAPPEKKRSPWLYVTLGVVGGILVLFAILFVIGLIYNHLNSNSSNSTTGTSSDTSTSTSTGTSTSAGGNIYSNPTGSTTSTTPSAPSFVAKQVLTAQAGQIWDTALSSDASMLVSGEDDKTIKLWNLATNDVRTLSRQDGPILGVAMTPDGQQVASASRDNSLFTWNTANGNALMKFPGNFPLWTVAYSPDGSVIAAAGDGKTISMWSLPSGKYLGAMQDTGGQINRIRFSPDGRLLAGGGDDDIVYLWSVADQSEVAELKSHTSNILSVAFSPDGSHLATADAKGNIYLWNVGTGTLAPSKMFASNDGAAVNDLVFTPDGNYVISASDDKNIGVWDASSGNQVTTLTGHTDSVLSLSLSRDGKLLVSSSKDGTIRLWQLSNGQ
ncbi:MAG: protein kinase [Candidatus Acidiferrales bacterium]|jgi:serine/threonine-protein kinase